MNKVLSMTVIATIAITGTIASFPAQAGFFDKIFGGSQEEEPKGPPPEVTLQAPFPTSPDAKANQGKLMDIYGSQPQAQAQIADLSIPHRNEQQITDWTTEIVTQAMTINPATYNKDFAKIAGNFTPYALQEYQAYLTKTNMINVLTSNSFRLQAISDEEGSVVRDGAIGDTYHWLVQIPLMTSFYNVDMQTVDKSTNSQNQSLLVQVQVGRVAPKSNNDIGLVIERWSVSSNSK